MFSCPIYIDETTHYIPVVRKYRDLMQAPGKHFDHDRSDGCLAACMLVCGPDKPCPFGGCVTDAAGFNARRPSPTLH